MPGEGGASSYLFLFHPEGSRTKHKIRIVMRAGEPWWVLADVCAVLEISNSRDAAARLDDDERVTVANPDGRAGSGAQEFTIINESGLWSLVLTSRKPGAKAFKKWLTGTVIPAPAGGPYLFLFHPENSPIRYKVRALMRSGEPWWVLADVCSVLDIANPSQAAARLDADEKATLTNNEGRPGHGAQTHVIINESGLWSLVLTSRRPEARAFKKWLTATVIPSLRKNGGYLVGQETMTDSERMAEAVLFAQRMIATERGKRERAEARTAGAFAGPSVAFSRAGNGSHPEAAGRTARGL